MKKKKPRLGNLFTRRKLSHLTEKDWKMLIPAMTAPQRQGVAQGAEAWSTFETKRMTWWDWMQVSDALSIGESICAEASGGQNRGGKYIRLYGKWLEENGLDNIAKTVRAWLREIRQHQTEIDAWRNSLPIEQRMKMQHPRTVLRKWKQWKAEQLELPL
jgi:hypothetical protein